MFDTLNILLRGLIKFGFFFLLLSPLIMQHYYYLLNFFNSTDTVKVALSLLLLFSFFFCWFRFPLKRNRNSVNFCWQYWYQSINKSFQKCTKEKRKKERKDKSVTYVTAFPSLINPQITRPDSIGSSVRWSLWWWHHIHFSIESLSSSISISKTLNSNPS